MCAGASPATTAAPADDLLALRERLIGTVWRLELKPMFGEPLPEPLSDMITFSGGQVASQYFGSQGYSPSAFTVAIGADGVEVWEATQLNLDAGIVLWKGELEGGTVRGIVSRQPLEGVSQDFVFIGEEVEPEPEPQPEPSAPATEAAPAEPSAVETPAPVIEPITLPAQAPTPNPATDPVPIPMPATEAAPTETYFEPAAPVRIQAIPDAPAAPAPTPLPAVAPAAPAADDIFSPPTDDELFSPPAPEPDEAKTNDPTGTP